MPQVQTRSAIAAFTEYSALNDDVQMQRFFEMLMTALKTLHHLTELQGSPIEERSAVSQDTQGFDPAELLEVGIASHYKELPEHPSNSQTRYKAEEYWTGIEPKFKITLHKQPMTPMHRYETYQASITRFDIEGDSRPKTTSISLDIGNKFDPRPIMQEFGAWVMHCRPDISALFFIQHPDFYPDAVRLHHDVETNYSQTRTRVARAKREASAKALRTSVQEPLKLSLNSAQRSRELEDEYFARLEHEPFNKAVTSFNKAAAPYTNKNYLDKDKKDTIRIKKKTYY